MAINEGEATGAVMVRGRQVAPLGCLGGVGEGGEDEPTIVDAVGMLVQEDVDHRGVTNIARFNKLVPGGIDRRPSVILRSDKRVHRIDRKSTRLNSSHLVI